MMSAITSFLLAIAPLSGAILQIVGWIASVYGMSETNLAKYQAIIDNANAATDLSMASRLKHQQYIDEIKKELAEQKAKEAPNDQTKT